MLLDVRGSVVFGIIEMQKQFATRDVTLLLSLPAGQGNNHVVNKIYRCGRRSLWQQVYDNEFLRVEEDGQH
jgi:hypothetical protein